MQHIKLEESSGSHVPLPFEVLGSVHMIFKELCLNYCTVFGF
jgi:hypothetical protein